MIKPNKPLKLTVQTYHSGRRVAVAPSPARSLSPYRYVSNKKESGAEHNKGLRYIDAKDKLPEHAFLAIGHHFDSRGDFNRYFNRR